jgi:hypothetical protein
MYAVRHLSILDVPSKMLHFSKELWDEAHMMQQGLSDDDCMITSFDAGDDENCTMTTSLVDDDFPHADSLFAANCDWNETHLAAFPGEEECKESEPALQKPKTGHYKNFDDPRQENRLYFQYCNKTSPLSGMAYLLCRSQFHDVSPSALFGFKKH